MQCLFGLLQDRSRQADLDKMILIFTDTIYDVVDMFLSPSAGLKGLRMAVLFYNDVPLRINGDALRLKQVLTNIVGNQSNSPIVVMWWFVSA